MNPAGLLGYLGYDLDPARLLEAQRRAPWRGTATSIIRHQFGTLVALGCAEAAVHAHVGVTLHGRIDNSHELAEILGVHPNSTADLIAEAYLRYGKEFPVRLLGDFSILVLDQRRRTLLATRDWIGTRPLFWGEHRSSIAFGSEVKQVLALLDRAYELDEETASSYASLTSQPRPSATFANGIHAIVPSSQVLFENGREPIVSTRPIYFEPVQLSMDEAAEAIRERLDAAIQRRLRGSLRPAALLSGGMDSTSVVASASALALQGVVAPLTVAASLRFPEVPQSDESSYSKQVAEFCSVPWSPVTISPREVADDPGQLLALHDGPVFPGIHFFVGLFREAARLKADVMLTGLGADAWQQQYDEEMKFAVLRHEWKTALYWAHNGLQQEPIATLKRIARTAQVLVQGRTESEFLSARAKGFWIRLGFETEERLGQYYGMRTEAPFVDRELAELICGLSPRVRSNTQMSKLPLRAAMKERLPDSVLSRKDKSFFDPVFAAGFGLPTNHTLVGREVSRHYVAAWQSHIAAGAPWLTCNMDEWQHNGAITRSHPTAADPVSHDPCGV